MSMSIRVLRVTSDNFIDQLMTFDAYELLKLEMSSGDFGSHTKEVVEVDDYEHVLTKEYFQDECEHYDIDEDSRTCLDCDKDLTEDLMASAYDSAKAYRQDG